MRFPFDHAQRQVLDDTPRADDGFLGKFMGAINRPPRFNSISVENDFRVRILENIRRENRVEF